MVNDAAKQTGSSIRMKSKKRAMSMATGMPLSSPKLSPRSKRRSLGPPKGILKSRLNLGDDTSTLSIPVDAALLAADSKGVDGDTVRGNRMSLSRRVSFAPQARVRTISPKHTRSSKASPRRSSGSSDGEHSMELEDSIEEPNGEDNTMEATQLYGFGIDPADASSTDPLDFKPTARSSLAPSKIRRPSLRTSEANSDETHPIDQPLRPPRPPSQAFMDLQNVISENFGSGDLTQSDMDIDEAVERLTVARNSLTAEQQSNDCSSSISEDSFQVDQTIGYGSGILPIQHSETAARSIHEDSQQPYLSTMEVMNDAKRAGSLFGAQEGPMQLVDSSLEMLDNGSVDLSFAPLEANITQRLFSVQEQTPRVSSNPAMPIEDRVSNDTAHSPNEIPSKSSARSSRLILPDPEEARAESRSDHALDERSPSVSSLSQLKGATRRTSRYSRAGQGSTQFSAVPQEVYIESNPNETAIIAVSPNVSNTSPHGQTASPSKAGRVRRSSSIPGHQNAAFEDALTTQAQRQPNSISIEQFFIMTGVQFMDEIACPRKSVIRSSFSGRRDSEPGQQTECDVADYFLAINLAIPQLNIYSWVARELRKWIEDSKEVHHNAEEEVAKVTPAQFVAYAEADEEDRREFTSHLKLVKACEQMRAKATWYKWKRDWMFKSMDQCSEAVRRLERDHSAVRMHSEQLEGMIPKLQQRKIMVISELDNERRIVAEVESCDQTQLLELKNTISEQTGILEEFETRISESLATQRSLSRRLQELQEQQQECRQITDGLRRKIALQTGSTTSGVFKLKEELECIQALSVWKVKDLRPNMISLIYGSHFSVSLPCSDFTPIARKLEVVALPRRQHMHDSLPGFLDHMIRVACEDAIANSRQGTTSGEIVRRLGDSWASLSQVHFQLKVMIAQFPVQLSFEGNELVATATLLFRNIGGKALVQFHFNSKTLCSWPMDMVDLKVDARTVYGPVSPQTIVLAIEDRLAQSSLADNHACLQDACCAALAKYS